MYEYYIDSVKSNILRIPKNATEHSSSISK
jgi:hypothetical protein